MYAPNDLASDLEKKFSTGFDVCRISKFAFEIYQRHGLEFTPPMDQILLLLMAMEEGEEFELTESEFLGLISELRTMD
ncbi:hypothetical protein [Pseudomonas synxantha]|uniref:hypothetical protein n=1 Tax=Pseudomonas synxantha TaxID=47883 RepID=UPI000F5824E9|nr:hypothetical protein [Pseudomonas synxantha]AZE75979.1 hypothetical protein C4J99_0161 [Pseudomonas synxantha]